MAYKIGSFNVRNKLFEEIISDGGESDYSIISKLSSFSMIILLFVPSMTDFKSKSIIYIDIWTKNYAFSQKRSFIVT